MNSAVRSALRRRLDRRVFRASGEAAAGAAASFAVRVSVLMRGTGRHFAAAMSRSIWAAASARPFLRSVTWPFSYLWARSDRVSW